MINAYTVYTGKSHVKSYFQDLSYHERIILKLSLQGVKKVTQSMAYLESVFPGRLISKRLWPPRSPDLSPPDFFLWGISRIMCVQIIHTHTARASGQHSAHCGQDINWHIEKRVR
jgi:hypothetical protein